jgi:hypothetical protein
LDTLLPQVHRRYQEKPGIMVLNQLGYPAFPQWLEINNRGSGIVMTGDNKKQ